jgi:GNAT superfamily N-acetyltransferase
VNRDEALELEKRALHDWLAVLGSAAPESTVFEADGVRGAVVPAAPDRSIPNSISYLDADALIGGLDALDAAYSEAGVRARGVWVPAFDTEAIVAVEAAGYSFDSEPTAMTLEFDRFEAPAETGLEWNADGDPVELGRINDLAYGLSADDGMAAALVAPGPQLTLYEARVRDEAACVLGTMDHGSDLGVYFVATEPRHQGAGLAGRLVSVALKAARERGLKTASLQSSARGKPVYAALGFKEHFSFRLYEHRV